MQNSLRKTLEKTQGTIKKSRQHWEKDTERRQTSRKHNKEN